MLFELISCVDCYTKPAHVKTDRSADLSSKEILNKTFEEDVARAVFYFRIKQFQLEIYFQKQHVWPT